MLTFFCLAPAIHNDFVSWDDQDYILNNESIRALTWSNVKEIFSQFVVGSYHPLTTLTFAVEYHWFGLDPLPYHGTNIILHLINTLLVYFFILKLTGRKQTAIITMLLFGIHPMRVESVAWAVERKDVLFALFYLSGLIAYLSRPARSAGNAILVFSCFLCALLAKPAAVSFPVVICLMDYLQGRPQDRRRVLEKLLFLGTALFFGGIALYGNAATPLEQGVYLTTPAAFSIWDKAVLTGHALMLYIYKCILPYNLSAFYPYPDRVAHAWPWFVYVNSLFIVFINGIIFNFLRRKKEIVFGLLFFEATIFFNLPVFGAGHTIIADRFGYIPFIGLFIIISAGIEQITQMLIRRDRHYQTILAVVGVLLVMLMVSATRAANQKWEDNWALWNDVIQKAPGVGLAYANRADIFLKNNRLDLAGQDINRAIELNANDANAYGTRGIINLLSDHPQAALSDFNTALSIRPDLVSVLHNRAACYLYLNDCAHAVEDFEAVLRLNPNHALARQQIRACRDRDEKDGARGPRGF